MKIKDLKKYINGDFEKISKKIGVILVETGFLNYSKLNSENYEYWWYEVENINEINKKNHTYCWSDLKRTRKFKILELLIDFHEENESIFTLLNNSLNIISALGDGIDKETKIPCFITVFNMYYEGRKIKEKQLELFN